jgi:hypothetical protein
MSSASTPCKTAPTSTTWHATILHLLGLDHLKLTFKFQGKSFRPTDVAGDVIHKLIA